MPRPRKGRRVCEVPNFNTYGPISAIFDESEMVVMKVEEFEAIRLMDLEGLNQEQCAEKMDVARSTVQRIYNDARKKIANSLIYGKILKIEGGDYIVCERGRRSSHCLTCYHGKHNHRLV